MHDQYAPAAGIHHYLSMARGNVRDYLQGEEVRLKKYFYVLRPMLAADWILDGRGIPPMQFGALVDAMVREETVKSEIAELLKRKMAGDELDKGPRNHAISNFIDSTLNRLESGLAPRQPPKTGIEPLNQFFREALITAWAG